MIGAYARAFFVANTSTLIYSLGLICVRLLLATADSNGFDGCEIVTLVFQQ